MGSLGNGSGAGLVLAGTADCAVGMQPLTNVHCLAYFYLMALYAMLSGLGLSLSCLRIIYMLLSITTPSTIRV